MSDVVMVQNQSGPHPLKWDKSGTVVEVLPFDQYNVKMDGSGRLSLRNRKFLKPITPFTTGLTRQTTTTTSPPPNTLPLTPTPAPHQPVEEQQQVTGGREDETQSGNVDLGEQTEALHHAPLYEDQEHHAPDREDAPEGQPAGNQEISHSTRKSGRERRLPRRLQDYQL